MGIGNITKLLPQWLLRGGRRCKTAANTLCGPGQGNGGIIFQIRSDNLQTDWQTGRTLPDGYHRRRQVRYGGQTGPDGDLGEPSHHLAGPAPNRLDRTNTGVRQPTTQTGLSASRP